MEHQEETYDLVHGMMVNDVFWHSKDNFEKSHVVNDRNLAKVQPKVRIAWILMSLASLVGFLAYIGLSEPTEITVKDVGFLWLWLSALFGMIAISYGQRIKGRHVRLPIVDEINSEPTTIPGLEVVDRHSPIWKTLTKDSQASLEEAFLLASEYGHQSVTALHIFVGLLSQNSVLNLVVRMDLSIDDLKQPIARQFSILEKGNAQSQDELHDIIVKAFAHALKNKQKQIHVADLLAVVYNENEFLQDLLYALDVTDEEFRHVLAWARIDVSLRERYEEFRRSAAFKPTGAMNRAYTSVQTKFLDSVAYDLTKSAVSGHLPMLVGRSTEMDTLLRSIEGGRQSVVLVGESGVGKEAIISGLAQKMVDETVPDILKDKRLMELSLSHLIGADGGTHAQERLMHALNEVGRSGNIILVIPNIDQLFVAHMGGLDLASILAGELEKGYTFVIATTSPQSYTNSIESSLLGSMLQAIHVEEPEFDACVKIMEAKIGGIENKHKVVFTYDAVSALIKLSDRYFHESYLPEKAILLAQEVALIVSKRGVEWAKVKANDVSELVSTRANVKVTEVTKTEGSELLQLESRMHERMIGQDSAVKAVSSALRRARAELRSEGRPIATFLFLGPTGVGKTELAKTTAEVYFGSEDAMARFDMSEYQDAASIERLIGGANEHGQLTEAIRRNPFTVLLLDELEKAHPDILNIFLQVMEDGRLTDGTGRTIDFTNVILIATSNAGTQYILNQTAAGVDAEKIKQVLLEEKLQEVYRPEFLNRFDGVMVFKPLTREDMVSIAYLMISSVQKRLETKGIVFEITDAAIHELAAEGYDPQFGARPLRRVIQDKVDNKIADILLAGDVGRRDAIVFDVGGKISVKKADSL